MHNNQPIKVQTNNAYNWLAGSYAEKWCDNLDKELVDHFLRFVEPGSRVLDVGCGPGHYTKFFLDAGLDIFGIDLSKGMLSQASKICPDGGLAQMDLYQLGFPDRQFDALWVCASFPHVHKDDAEAVLREFKRVLKSDKNGHLLVNIIVSSLPFRVESIKEMGSYKQPGRFFQHYPNKKSFEKYLVSAGFSIIHVVNRVVHSEVVAQAHWKTNEWVNFFCQPI